MKAFDTDIFTEILAGNPAYAERIAQVPVDEQAVPIVAVEEIIRGRLNAIRQTEAAAWTSRRFLAWKTVTLPIPPSIPSGATPPPSANTWCCPPKHPEHPAGAGQRQAPCAEENGCEEEEDRQLMPSALPS